MSNDHESNPRVRWSALLNSIRFADREVFVRG